MQDVVKDYAIELSEEAGVLLDKTSGAVELDSLPEEINLDNIHSEHDLDYPWSTPCC
jgi:hypothetical protein